MKQALMDSSPLKKSSRDIYLHFLDRELLTAIGAYGHIPYSNIVQDLRLILFSTYESAYLSTSLIFENQYSRKIFKEFPLLFQAGHIELALKENSLASFILSKREQYKHASELYRFYYDDTWKIVAEFSPVFRSKTMDTGKFLENDIVANIQEKGVFQSANKLDIDVSSNEIEILEPYIVDSLRERNGLAVTKLLFSSSYNKKYTSKPARKAFNIKVNESYVKAYLHEFSGTIATGLSSGIEYFSYLCPTFPLHHLPLWRQIYLRLGCLRFIRNMNQEEILIVRESPEFHNFIRRIRVLIREAMNSIEEQLDLNLLNVTYFLSNLKITLTDSINTTLSSPKNIDDFLKVIESASADIDCRYSESQSSYLNGNHSKSLFISTASNNLLDYLLSQVDSSTLEVILNSSGHQKRIGIAIIQELKVIMGDTFENIGNGTTIINRSNIQNLLSQTINDDEAGKSNRGLLE